MFNQIKKKMKKISFYLLLVAILAGGCKKYEEGPLISFRSKEKRLCQDWEVDKYIANGETEYPESGEFEYWDFDDDGTLQITAGMPGWESVVWNLTWEWSDDKEEIKVYIDDYYKSSLPFILAKSSFKATNEVIEFEIIKLKYDEMVLEFSEDGDEVRAEFKKRD